MIRFLTALIWVVFWAEIPLSAQTLINLQTQSKSVNFKGAPLTIPMKTGGALPATCTQGEMFFLTTAAAGANLYGCPLTNTWAAQSGGGRGTTTIQNAGTVVGMRTILNLSDGPGLLLATSDTGTAIAIQYTLDTAVAATRASEQSGTALSCNSASSSATTHTCALSPTLTQYTADMVLHWTPDISNMGGSITLNIDSLGATPVKLQDGITDPAPLDLVSGRMQEIWFDGAAFRLLKPANPSGILGEIQPSCSGAVRGRLWFVAGGMGTKDSLAVCAKDATDALAWRTLY
jgi:hypothetical protein